MTLPNPRPLSYRQVIDHLDNHRQLVQTAQVEAGSGPVVIDSRQVTDGDIFLALSGIDDDGNNYLTEAEANGAGLCLSDQPRNSSPTTAIVKDSRLAWSQLCSLAYDHPENQLTLIGITGTNGKSSTTWMLNQMLSLSGYRSMLIGGLGIYCGERWISSNPLTTPDPDLLYRLLAYARQENISHVVMEVSSHAIALQKVGALTFDVCIFTSFSQDHLDFHQTLSAYFRCKWQFIEQNRKEASLVVLHDTVYQRALVDGYRCQHPNLWCYGQELTNQTINHQTMQYNMLKLKGLNAYAEISLGERVVGGWLNFFAVHAVGNFAVSLLTMHQLSLTREVFPPQRWGAIGQPPGRLEVVCQTPLVVVDYAHTPEALALSLKSLSFVGELTVVFGCGGGRDRQKRRVMGRVAERLADRIILTNDNPRDDNPATIVEDICKGITDRDKVTVILDRRLAIERAICGAAAKDCAVLVAGKGCEDYQEIAGQRPIFDDRRVCRSVLAGG